MRLSSPVRPNSLHQHHRVNTEAVFQIISLALARLQALANRLDGISERFETTQLLLLEASAMELAAMCLVLMAPTPVQGRRAGKKWR
jgi:hypothetical protein